MIYALLDKKLEINSVRHYMYLVTVWSKVASAVIWPCKISELIELGGIWGS